VGELVQSALIATRFLAAFLPHLSPTDPLSVLRAD
jgi:hypothetical protein